MILYWEVQLFAWFWLSFRVLIKRCPPWFSPYHVVYKLCWELSLTNLGEMVTESYWFCNSRNSKFGDFSFLLSTKIYLNLMICISAFSIQCGDSVGRIKEIVFEFSCRSWICRFSVQTSRTVIKKKGKSSCFSSEHITSEWWGARIAVMKYNVARNFQRVSRWDFEMPNIDLIQNDAPMEVGFLSLLKYLRESKKALPHQSGIVNVTSLSSSVSHF